MAGAGNQGAGSSAAGPGTPALAAVPSGGFLVNVRDGEPLGARAIDPHTRDYVLDAGSGRIVGVGSVRQAVQLSLTTERGSSVVYEMGHDLRRIQRITPDIERRILATLSDALAPLVRLGLVEIVGLTNYRAGNDTNGMRRGAVYARFAWRDRTTGTEYTEVI